MPLRSRILTALAAVLTLVALLGTWVDRQLLNTDDWVDTSTALLRDDTIRRPLADAISAQVADGSRATELLQEVLPPRLQPLAPQAGALVREAAQRATERLLDGPRIQQLWIEANRLTHEQLVDLVDGGGTVVAGRGLVLDLRPIAAAVVQEGGFSGDRIERLPPGGRIILLRPDQLRALRSVGDLLGTLAWLPGVIAVLLYGLAIWLAGSGRRRAVLAAGATFLGVGLVLLLVRRAAGHALVDAVAAGGPYVPAAQSVWRIVTTLLAELAAVVIVVGAVAVAGAWLAGPGRRASALRARVAPLLAAPAGAVLGGAALAYLALLAWGPLSVLRRPLPIVLFAVLLLAGVWLLRAQVLAEEAEPEPAGPTRPAADGA